MPPTHFLALQVSQAQNVVRAIEHVQMCLVEHLPMLRDALVDPASAHLTLCVAELADEAQACHCLAVKEGQKALQWQPLNCTVSMTASVLHLYSHYGLFKREALFQAAALDVCLLQMHRWCIRAWICCTLYKNTCCTPGRLRGGCA